jgi:hypothetical protein
MNYFMDYLEFISLSMVILSRKFSLLFLTLSPLDHYTCQHTFLPHPHSILILNDQFLACSLQYETPFVIKHHRLIFFSLNSFMKNVEFQLMLVLNYYWFHFQLILDIDLSFDLIIRD